ncbi:MAG TPA: DsbC family protein [Candidatus Binatia bacterium]|nr:DsbC family protein [Candidatus Binatia bacterium]
MSRPAYALLLLAACTACASAEDPQLEQVRKKVMAAIPGLDKNAIQPSSAPGLYQVQKGQTFAYVTGDGRFMVQGDMVDLSNGEEITEKQRKGARLQVLKQFGPDGYIEFAPKSPKYVITVFTDIDCGYCRRLHSEIKDYNAQNIAVRYLFYPRSGPDTPSFAKAEQVWCSADRKQALTQAKQGQPLNGPSNCANPVLKQWQAGEAIGVNATPIIMLPDGEMVRGYVPAAQLVKRLAENDKVGLK